MELIQLNQLSKENAKLLYRKQAIVKKKKREILDKFHVMRFLLYIYIYIYIYICIIFHFFVLYNIRFY